MAAAVALTQAGHHVTVMEAAAPWVGGRGHCTPWMQRASPRAGQRATHPDWCLHRNPAFDAHGGRGRAQRHAAPPPTLTYADRSGLELPNRRPLGCAGGAARARGWSWTDKVALLRTCASWQLKGFRCDARWSVAQLCESLPQRLLQEFIEACAYRHSTPRARGQRGSVLARVARQPVQRARWLEPAAAAHRPGYAVPGYRCAVAASPGRRCTRATRGGPGAHR